MQGTTAELLAPTAGKKRPSPQTAKEVETGWNEGTNPRNKGQFTYPNKNTGTDLNLSIISDDEFDCYNKSERKPILTKIDDELQLLPKENNLTPGQGRFFLKKTMEPTESVRRSNRLPFAKKSKNSAENHTIQRIPRKKFNSDHLLQETTAETMERNEEETNRSIRKDEDEIRLIRHHKMTQQTLAGGRECDIIPTSWPSHVP